MTTLSRLGELLVRRGQLEAAHLERAMTEQRTHGARSRATLVKLGFINEDALLSYLQKEYRLPVVDPSNLDIPPEVLGLVPAAMAQKHHLIPVNLVRSTLTIAMADPSNLVAINEVKFLTGYDVKIAVAGATAIQRALDRYYDAAANYDQMLNELGESGDVQLVQGEEEVSLQDLERATEEAPVVRLVNALLTDAIKKRASDVHIEPYEKMLRVRFRMDGVLYEIMQPPVKLKNAITSRIKVMAALDIAERRMPQDGRIKLKLGANREMDFRVSVLPTHLRREGRAPLARQVEPPARHDQARLRGEGARRLQGVDLPPARHGAGHGPTGSGKTTTLYSALAELNKTASNISTAEDPVEFNLVGINQVQMHEGIGLTFAASLRSFLRQDPDIIMVGEIRDFETAEIGVKAALTGHLVLSTLHTNDAPSTINRLLNMGVEPFLVASSINLIMAQRLVRVICANCKEDSPMTPESLVDIGVPPRWQGR